MVHPVKTYKVTKIKYRYEQLYGWATPIFLKSFEKRLQSVTKKLIQLSICQIIYLNSRHIDGTLINKIYYFYSLGWLLFRACSVVLSAADIKLHSKRALSYLYVCPSSVYNIEVRIPKHFLRFQVVLCY